MQNTIYEDNKYCIQDVGNLYLGAKYTMADLLEAEDIPFKFKLIAERYILPKAHQEDTLETHLYYLEQNDFLIKIYKQLKARVKISIIEEKKTLFGKRKKQYTTRIVTVEELKDMILEEKMKKGVVIMELIVSKLAMMSF